MVHFRAWPPARRLKILFVALLTFLFTYGVVQSSRAQQRDVRTHITTGNKAARAKDWDLALQEYSAAHAASPSSEALLGIANAHYQKRSLGPAFEAYDELIASYSARLRREDKRTAETRLAELRPLTGYLSIRVNETGAAVSIDGLPLGVSPVRALVRVAIGSHQVAVTKQDFAPFQRSAEVAADGKTIVEVALQKAAPVAVVVVREKAGQSARVVIDGVDVGAAPYEGSLSPGTHQITLRSATHSAPTRQIDVAAGSRTEIELETTPFSARIEIRTQDGTGTILVDGKRVGEGSYSGEASVGPHTISVTRPGFETFEKKVELVDNQVLVETVALVRSAGELTAAREKGSASTGDGLYGGFQALGLFMPTGSDHSVETSCASLGATSCEASSPKGGGLAGYVGYAFYPVGLEVHFGAKGDAAQPKAHFDGVQGSEINPLAAAPARTEEFLFARGGGFAAVRARVSLDRPAFRVSLAAGVGASWNLMALSRTTKTPDGGENKFKPDPLSYWSPVVSLDLSAQWRLGRVSSLVLGLFLLAENASSSVRTPPQGDQRISGGTTSTGQAVATPAYDMANGAQVFLGPYLGMQFGP